MDLETELYLVEMWQKKQLAVLKAKQADYAGPADVLWNFESRHLICKILDVRPADRECDVYINDMILKLQRVCNLLHADRPPKNESVDDTLGDLINYTTLLRLFLAEERNAKPEPEAQLHWPNSGIYCGECGVPQSPEARVSYTPDPLLLEVDNDLVMRWYCAKCWSNRHDEV